MSFSPAPAQPLERRPPHDFAEPPRQMQRVPPAFEQKAPPLSPPIKSPPVYDGELLPPLPPPQAPPKSPPNRQRFGDINRAIPPRPPSAPKGPGIGGFLPPLGFYIPPPANSPPGKPSTYVGLDPFQGIENALDNLIYNFQHPFDEQRDYYRTHPPGSPAIESDPPFRGGQSAVQYKVVFQKRVLPDTWLNETKLSLGTGPIAGIRIRNIDKNQTGLYLLSVPSNQLNHFTLEILKPDGWQSIVSSGGNLGGERFIRLERTDGQPDDGGDPPFTPSYEQHYHYNITNNHTNNNYNFNDEPSYKEPPLRTFPPPAFDPRNDVRDRRDDDSDRDFRPKTKPEPNGKDNDNFDPDHDTNTVDNDTNQDNHDKHKDKQRDDQLDPQPPPTRYPYPQFDSPGNVGGLDPNFNPNLDPVPDPNPFPKPNPFPLPIPFPPPFLNPTSDPPAKVDDGSKPGPEIDKKPPPPVKPTPDPNPDCSCSAPVLEGIKKIQDKLEEETPDEEDCCDEILAGIDELKEKLDRPFEGTITSHKCEKYCPDGEPCEDDEFNFEGAGLAGLSSHLEALSKQIEAIRNDVCKVDTIAAIPEWWQVRLGADRPQLIVLYGEDKGKDAQGKQRTGQSRWAVSIPHYNGNKKPSFPKYKKGQWEGIITLKDNSKLIVNCTSQPEAERVLDAFKRYINPTFLEGSFLKIGVRKGQKLKQVFVIPTSAKFFETGQMDTQPTWAIYFS